MPMQRILQMKFDAQVYKFKGTVDTVSGWDTLDVNQCVAKLRRIIGKESALTGLAPLISVDTEYPAWGIDRSVALIQVGNPEYALLVRTRIGKSKLQHLPPDLIDLLRDPSIEKVGSCINADVTKINKAFPAAKLDAATHNYFELKPIVRGKCPTRNNKYGLQDMCRRVLDCDLEKDRKLRCSNWKQEETLSEDQMRYAAGDVGAPCEIYRRLTTFQSRAQLKSAVDACLKVSPNGDCSEGPFGPIAEWDVSGVTDMSEMFINVASFNADLSKWDVSSVTNMENMFAGAASFNSGLSKWDVSRVTNMNAMFARATQLDISKWNTSSVINMTDMFLAAKSFNGHIPKEDVSTVGDRSVSNISRVFSPQSTRELKRALATLTPDGRACKTRSQYKKFLSQQSNADRQLSYSPRAGITNSTRVVAANTSTAVSDIPPPMATSADVSINTSNTTLDNASTPTNTGTAHSKAITTTATTMAFTSVNISTITPTITSVNTLINMSDNTSITTSVRTSMKNTSTSTLAIAPGHPSVLTTTTTATAAAIIKTNNTLTATDTTIATDCISQGRYARDECTSHLCVPDMFELTYPFIPCACRFRCGGNCFCLCSFLHDSHFDRDETLSLFPQKHPSRK